MALVENYNIGNAQIKIYDDSYLGKSPEEINKILKQISNIANKYYPESCVKTLNLNYVVSKDLD